MPQAKLDIAFILLPNFTLTPFATIVDMLRLAADEGDRSRPIDCRWTILGTPGESARASCGAEIPAWERLADPGRFHYVVVVGGLLRRSHKPDAAILSFLKDADAAGVSIVGLCTGVFLMAQAGLTAGRRACVSWFHLQDFAEEFPNSVPDATHLFAADGRIVTCAGGAGALDLGAWLIERHLGPARARKALRILLVDRARPIEAVQPPPAAAGRATDERVRRAVLLLEQAMSTPPKVKALARAVGVSSRQLERIFGAAFGLGPLEFSRRMRLNHALWRLANTRDPVTAVAADSGFADVSHFSRAFRKAFGRTPSSIHGMREQVAPLDLALRGGKSA